MKYLVLFVMLLITSKHLYAAEDLAPNTTIPSGPQVGIIYMVWHCMANNPERNKVIENAMIDGKWGKIPDFHWRNTPAATGNIKDYCTTNRSLIEKHMDMLEAAKIDYLVIDFTNQCYFSIQKTDCGTADAAMIESFNLLLKVSAERNGKIKIVPWVPFRGELYLKLANMMNKYPTSQFQFQGKPLMIASWDVDRRQNDVGNAIKTITDRGFNVKKMWGLHNGSLGADVWSFMEHCTAGFKESGGNAPCGQFTHPELSSISAAYQDTYITNFETAVPKFGGRTFLRQMETAISRGSPLILINSWNEWIAQRFCLDQNGNHTHLCYDATGNNIGNHFPGGRPVFVDSFTREYSRDFEPDTKSSEYYELLKKSVITMKTSKVPGVAINGKVTLNEAQAKEYLDLNLDVKTAYNSKPATDTRSITQYASDHYNAFSEKEGRPRSVAEYLNCNPDVALGFYEPSINTNKDEAKTNIVAFVAKHFALLVQPTPLPRAFRTFGCMNLEKYLACYGDVMGHCTRISSGSLHFLESIKVCALNHYNTFGKNEQRDGVSNCNSNNTSTSTSPAVPQTNTTAPIEQNQYSNSEFSRYQRK